MSSLREQILTAALAALSANRPEGIPEAERARTMAIEAEQLPKIIVYGPRDKAQDIGGKQGPVQEKSLELEVECWAAQDAERTADQAVDPLYVWVVRTLARNKLGGLLINCRESETVIALDETDATLCLATVTMKATYQQRADDPEVQA